jgi:nickel transport protein
MVARALDLQELEAMVSRLLDQKLAPIKAQLAQQNAKDPVTLHDVVSGLGWILGLVGIAAWFLGRKAKPAAPPARRQP